MCESHYYIMKFDKRNLIICNTNILEFNHLLGTLWKNWRIMYVMHWRSDKQVIYSLMK